MRIPPPLKPGNAVASTQPTKQPATLASSTSGVLRKPLTLSTKPVESKVGLHKHAKTPKPGMPLVPNKESISSKETLTEYKERQLRQALADQKREIMKEMKTQQQNNSNSQLSLVDAKPFYPNSK